MMRKLGPTKARYIGIGLIILGVFAALQLWWLLPPLILAGVGAYLYTERRREGRIVAAVQSGLWLFGMAVLFLFHFIIPGILVLAGASLLIRGREQETDRKISNWLDSVGIHLDPSYSVPVTYNTNVPITPVTQPPTVTPGQQPNVSVQEHKPNTGETTRL